MKEEVNMSVASRMTCKIGLIWRHMKTLYRQGERQYKKSINLKSFICDDKAKHYSYWILTAFTVPLSTAYKSQTLYYPPLYPGLSPTTPCNSAYLCCTATMLDWFNFWPPVKEFYVLYIFTYFLFKLEIGQVFLFNHLTVCHQYK